MSVFEKPASVDEDVVKNLGPLAPLAGTWEGDQGLDVAPSAEGPVETRFRERITFEPVGPVINGPQVLYGLRYATTAWPIGEEEAFHEEVGYWLWDPGSKKVMRYFIVPRGITVSAGGDAEPDAREFEMTSEVGSEIFGITSNPFLDEGFKTVRYELRLTIHEDGRFTYEENSHLRIKGVSEVFHHTDRNTLTKQG